MKGNIIVTGIILIVIGIILIAIGSFITSNPSSMNDILAGDAIINIGEYVTAGGIIAFCFGAFLRENIPPNQHPYQKPQYPQQSYPQQQYQPPIQTQQQFKYCMNCGKQVPIGSSLCPYCEPEIDLSQTRAEKIKDPDEKVEWEES